MRRQALCALLLLSGCDDPEVEGRALDILAHGVVYANAECRVTANTRLGAAVFDYQVTSFIDGSAQVIAGAATVGTARFYPRVAPAAYAIELRTNFSTTSSISLEVDSGDLVVTDSEATPPDDDPQPFAMGTYCTGFNLEAFGVAP